MEMQGCALYNYLNTLKGFCCERGWNWEDLATSQIMTGRQWLIYWEEYGTPCSGENVAVNTIPPVISGTIGVGNTLTGTTGTWTSPTPISGYTYRWYRNGSAISGATNSTYNQQSADIDKTITLRVIAINDDGDSLPTVSNGLLISTIPTNSVPPVISGVVGVGNVFSSTTGTWSAVGTISYGYQWKRDGVNIGGATNSTYAIQLADVDTDITCFVTASTSAGASTPESSNSILIATIPSNTILPNISGIIGVGNTLTSTTGTWSAVGTITYGYQWQRNGSNIVGETNSTYVIALADVDEDITCDVVATTDAGASSPATSNTLLIATIPTNSVPPVISGSTGVGDVLSSTTGTWVAVGTLSYAYQWQRNGVDIIGATGSTHTIVLLDVGEDITCDVEAITLAGTSSPSTSNAINIPSVTADVWGTSGSAIWGTASSYNWG